jgi:hypothetical protein
MRSESTPPRVFVSHASEDKERFVLPFAMALRVRGIDAWVDQWEILPGDSLVKKIFEEGIKSASAIIVVLSESSVQKPWVRAELDAGVVRQIEGVSRLIPVVIDECEIPEALRSTVWVRINAVDHYEEDLERIVMAIYEVRKKPKLGAPPPYVAVELATIPGLTEVDVAVLRAGTELAIESGQLLVSTEEVFRQLESLQFPSKELGDGVQVLHERGYIKAEWGFGSDVPPMFWIETLGFQTYAENFIADYSSVFTAVCARLVNNRGGVADEIARSLGKPPLLVEHIFDSLELRGLVKGGRSTGGFEIYEVSPQLRRLLKG